MNPRLMALLLSIFLLIPTLGCNQLQLSPSDPNAPSDQAEDGSSADGAANADAMSAGNPEDGSESNEEIAAGMEDVERLESLSEEDAAIESRGEEPGPAEGRPADMLSSDEMDEAVRLAMQSDSLESVVEVAMDRDAVDEEGSTRMAALESLSERPSYRVLYSERHVSKDENQRAAEVAVYRYDTGEVTVSKVDLTSGEVEALEAVPGMPPPLVPEEIEEASVVARANDDVRDALEDAGLDPDGAMANGILTIADGEDEICSDKRCVRLFFSSLRNPVPTFSVVVNLNDLAVVEVMPMPASEE